MNTLSRTITGGAMVLGGLVLIVLSFFVSFFLLIYSIPILIIGFFILFNKREDAIEEIKNMKSKKLKRLNN